MQGTLSTAIEMHENGQFGLAARLYEDVLASEPENAEALHLCGVLHHQRGDHRLATEMIGLAVSLRPNVAAYLANLAETYRAVGDFERAADWCRSALLIQPDYPEALCNLGAALQGMGQHAESVDRYRQVLELRPGFVLAHNNLGIALRELGNVEAALEHFRRAVELEPEFSPALSNLSQTLLHLGQSEEALTHAQEAIRLDPGSAVLHHNLGNVLRTLGRLDEARASYVEALRWDPDLALANARLGLVLQQDGQLNPAQIWLRRAVELEPENAMFWEWLAGLYDEKEESAEAIPCWERVLALGLDRAGPHVSLGWDLQQEGRADEVREHYLAAIRLQPGSGHARLSLGSLYEELGKMSEAEVEFREALQLQPGYALPHARLATLLRSKMSENDLAALENRLADDSLDRGPRARLLFGLAFVLDGRSEYRRAAECSREANAITLELAQGRREYPQSDHQRFTEVLIEAFNRDFVLRMANAGAESRRPVFMFGLPRSGTTLIEQVLGSHSGIHGAGELSLGRRSFESIPLLLDRAGPPRDSIAHLDSETVQRLADQHLGWLLAIDGGRYGRIVDKMPENYMYLGLLSTMFPRATFIHCRRDLRDVAVSSWMSDFRSVRWANDPDHIADRFRPYLRVMDHWRAVLKVPIHEVDYEETVADLESVARRLLAACGLDWEPACLEFYRNERPVRTASLTQVRQPIYQRSAGRWKNYEAVLPELFAALSRREVI
jgi:tetratricopeptide (TPR) repeat protein